MATKYKKRADGRFQASVWDGTYNANGTKHRITLYSTKSSRDLEAKVIAYKQRVQSGEHVVSNDVYFIDYARKWIETYKCVRSENTRKMYENIVEKHMIPLHGMRLVDLRKSDYQNLINIAMDQPRTCQQLALTFQQIIKAAMDDLLLPATAYRTICSGVSVPRYKADEKRPLSLIEKQAIKTADFSPMERAFVYLIYGCGLRRGEALALTIFDIDQKAGEISINKALAFDGNNAYVKDPKSIHSTRRIPMPDWLAQYLKAYTATLHGSLLFAKRDGSYITQSVYVKMWARIVKKMDAAAGGSSSCHVISGLTAHIFRHNYCTSLCYQIPDISMKRIAYLMGDNVQTVQNVYSHLMDEKKDLKETIRHAVNL